MMKKIILFALFFSVLVFGLSSQEKKEDIAIKFEQPILITSAGQSAEVQLASVLAKRSGLDYSLSKTATAKDLQNIKTLVLVLGASMKGLGAAGLDMAREKERVNMLIKGAQEKNIPIIGMHLGGESRRGKLSDETIIDFLPYAKMAIIVKSGNKDSLFDNICKENKIHLIEVDKTIDALGPLKNAFQSL